MARRLANPVASEPLRAGLQKLLGPAVVPVLVDAFLATRLGDAVVAAQSDKHDPELVLGTEVPTLCSLDVSYRLLDGVRNCVEFLSDLHSPWGYDQQKPSLP